MEPNEWLINRDFTARIKYDNAVYATRLFQKVYDLLKELPIPVISSYDPKAVQIYFTFLQNKKSFSIDDDIEISDYLTLVKRWVSQFFPKYEVSYVKNIPLDRDEVFRRIKEDKISIDEALELTKEFQIIEKAVINSIYLTDDLFRMNVFYNDKKEVQIRQCKKKKWYEFSRGLKDIENNNERRDFIFNNSEIISDEEELKQIYRKVPYFKELNNWEINYRGKKMYNFFSINYPELKNEPVKKIIEGIYQWGPYNIIFDTTELEELCLDYIHRKRADDMEVNFNV